MSPIRKKGISGKSRAVKPHTTEVIPEPPETCGGYLYTVRENDSLYSIAKLFHCPLQTLIKANPQVVTRSGTIFVRQLICIPDIEILPVTDLLPLGPQVLFVELLDAMGNELPVMNGHVMLAPRTFIRVTFSEPVSQAFFFFSEDGTLFLRPSFLAGVETLSPPQRSVRFVWDVPS
ncbi:MAG: LysM domain-containing protein, partial [Bacillota bacterium]|nr:LysM domain-containing protein [Bacillota bacterium]